MQTVGYKIKVQKWDRPVHCDADTSFQNLLIHKLLDWDTYRWIQGHDNTL
jgi:hypothetical protein